MAASKKRSAAATPAGERLAALETIVPELKDSMEQGFKKVADQIGQLTGSVQELVKAEAARLAVEAERAKQRNWRDTKLVAGAGFVGSAVTALVEWVRH